VKHLPRRFSRSFSVYVLAIPSEKLSGLLLLSSACYSAYSGTTSSFIRLSLHIPGINPRPEGLRRRRPGFLRPARLFDETDAEGLETPLSVSLMKHKQRSEHHILDAHARHMDATNYIHCKHGHNTFFLLTQRILTSVLCWVIVFALRAVRFTNGALRSFLKVLHPHFSLCVWYFLLCISSLLACVHAWFYDDMKFRIVMGGMGWVGDKSAGFSLAICTYEKWNAGT
jgi:hypothetical protein